MYGRGVMPGRQAGSGVGLHIAKSPKQGSKRFISITNTLLFAQLVILFFYGHCCHSAAKVLYLDVLVLVPDVLLKSLPRCPCPCS